MSIEIDIYVYVYMYIPIYIYIYTYRNAHNCNKNICIYIYIYIYDGVTTRSDAPIIPSSNVGRTLRPHCEVMCVQNNTQNSIFSISTHILNNCTKYHPKIQTIELPSHIKELSCKIIHQSSHKRASSHIKDFVHNNTSKLN